MIDEWNANLAGWARFSDDRRLRYRLRRMLTPLGIGTAPEFVGLGEYAFVPVRRVVFVMLNPSTADAFKLDPTVRKCCMFAQRWDADVLEVVNLFALRSPHPRDLYDRWRRGEYVGIDIENDRAILDACAWPNTRVIAAWGNHGSLAGRADYVRGLLRERRVEVERLGTTKEGFPLHPLARGKAWIPLTREPEVWAP